MDQAGTLTQTELHNHKLERARDLPHEQLDLDQQAVLRAGAVAVLEELARPGALGEGGGGGGQGRRDGVKVRGQGGGGGVLLLRGRVVLDRGGGLVCSELG